MSKDSTKQQGAKAEEKKTRKVLTPAERIAKLKADAEALEQREAQRAAAKVDGAKEKVSNLEARLADVQTKLDAARREVRELEQAAGISEDEATATS